MSKVVSNLKAAESQSNKYMKLLPGVSLCLAVGLVAHYLGTLYPLVGGAVFGIIFGILIHNTISLPSHMESGINFTAKKILKAAIIVLGAGLSLTQVWQTGSQSFLVIITTLAAAYAVTLIVGPMLGVTGNLKHLIGTGTAICGASAIAAIAPVLDAEDSEIAYSISTVFLFNIIAVLIFPYLGHLLGFNNEGFGIWAGTAINDTSSVVAAGYIFSDEAGAYATIVKLTRTTMIIPIALIYAGAVARRKKIEAGKSGGGDVSIISIIPWFILGFLGASLLNTLGVLNTGTVAAANWLGKFMIVMALVAVGLQANIKKMLKTGIKPIVLGLLIWIAVAVTSLIVQHYAYGHL